MNDAEIRERSCRFGEHGRLVGIVTEPAKSPRAAAVMVTAGLTPKFGPFRLYAQLARRLAGDGLLVLRFDLGGIGDSVPAHGALPLKKRTEEEIRAAVDHLSERGAPGGLVLGGLCSGAEDAFRYAAIDPRVTGLFLIDPFAFPTFGWIWRDYLIRGVRRGLALAGFLPTYRAGDGGRSTLIHYEYMRYDECSRIMRALVARKVGIHFLYTGGMRESFNHKRQFKAMFRDVDFQNPPTVAYFPQLRHTQVLEADRQLVIDSIARRLSPVPTGCPA